MSKATRFKMNAIFYSEYWLIYYLFMDVKLNTLNKKIHQKQRIIWSLWIVEHVFTYNSHIHAQNVPVCLSRGVTVGGSGWCWGDDAQWRALPPQGGLSASLSPAWSFIIYRRDKIKQTQQNGVKSESFGSHIYTLSHIERVAGDAHGAQFVQLLVPASQHPSASSSQVETLY